jgi:hypothetical protein
MSDALFTLDAINQSVSYLRERGCYRRNGFWLDADSTALGADPVEAVRALRHRAIKRVVEQKRSAGEHFHR